MSDNIQGKLAKSEELQKIETSTRKLCHHPANKQGSSPYNLARKKLQIT
jgi:hypothetical protein